MGLLDVDDDSDLYYSGGPVDRWLLGGGLLVCAIGAALAVFGRSIQAYQCSDSGTGIQVCGWTYTSTSVFFEALGVAVAIFGALVLFLYVFRHREGPGPIP